MRLECTGEGVVASGIASGPSVVRYVSVTPTFAMFVFTGLCVYERGILRVLHKGFSRGAFFKELNGRQLSHECCTWQFAQLWMLSVSAWEATLNLPVYVY